MSSSDPEFFRLQLRNPYTQKNYYGPKRHYHSDAVDDLILIRRKIEEALNSLEQNTLKPIHYITLYDINGQEHFIHVSEVKRFTITITQTYS